MRGRGVRGGGSIAEVAAAGADLLAAAEAASLVALVFVRRFVPAAISYHSLVRLHCKFRVPRDYYILHDFTALFKVIYNIQINSHPFTLNSIDWVIFRHMVYLAPSTCSAQSFLSASGGLALAQRLLMALLQS